MRPESDYLEAVGWAQYAFLYLEWRVIYALHYTTGESVASLEAHTPRYLSKRLNKLWAGVPQLAALAERHDRIVTKREHLVHSHPVTYTDDDGHERQMLYRRGRERSRAEQTILGITPEWLGEFAKEALALDRAFPDRNTLAEHFETSVS